METDVTVRDSFIKDELAKYNVTDEAVAKMKAEFLVLKVISPSDKEGYGAVRKGRLFMVKQRTEVEKMRKLLKKESLEYGRAVDAEAERITEMLLPIEKHLAEQEEIVLAEERRIKEEKERIDQAKLQERLDSLTVFGVVINPQFVKEMTDEEYAERLAKAKAEFEEKETARQAEENRIAKIKAEQEAEAKRLEAIRKEQAEKEAAIKAEQEARETKIRAEQEAIRKEQEKIEAEKRAITLAKEQAEAESLRKIEIEKAQKEAAERAVKEAEEKAKRDKEEAAKAEQARIAEEKRKEALRPVKEKLFDYVHAIERIELATMSDPKANDVALEARKIIVAACSKIRKLIETL